MCNLRENSYPRINMNMDFNYPASGNCMLIIKDEDCRYVISLLWQAYICACSGKLLRERGLSLGFWRWYTNQYIKQRSGAPIRQVSTYNCVLVPLTLGGCFCDGIHKLIFLKSFSRVRDKLQRVKRKHKHTLQYNDCMIKKFFTAPVKAVQNIAVQNIALQNIG